MSANKNLEVMVAQLSPYFTQFELDRVLDVMVSIDNSKFDINYTVEDAADQLRLILGRERYEEIKFNWSKNNQKLLSQDNIGTKKYLHKITGELFDGLDEHDKPEDYEVIFV